MSSLPDIRSGEWRSLAGARHYLAGLLDDLLIERVIWGDGAETAAAGGSLPARPGQVWYRFWLWRDDQVVERYFDAAGQPLGTQIDVCMPIRVAEEGWAARDLLLDIWIAPDGRVTVRREAEFEAAAAAGLFSQDEITWAEEHVRRLTTAIAQRRFPPAMVRNWQVDLQRIEETLQRL